MVEAWPAGGCRGSGLEVRYAGGICGGGAGKGGKAGGGDNGTNT